MQLGKSQDSSGTCETSSPLQKGVVSLPSGRGCGYPWHLSVYQSTYWLPASLRITCCTVLSPHRHPALLSSSSTLDSLQLMVFPSPQTAHSFITLYSCCIGSLCAVCFSHHAFRILYPLLISLSHRKPWPGTVNWPSPACFFLCLPWAYPHASGWSLFYLQ